MRSSTQASADKLLSALNFTSGSIRLGCIWHLILISFVLLNSILYSTYHIHSFNRSPAHNKRLQWYYDVTTLQCGKNSLHLVPLWGRYVKLAFHIPPNVPFWLFPCHLFPLFIGLFWRVKRRDFRDIIYIVDYTQSFHFGAICISSAFFIFINC